ncbi:MAG TPA: hypothetical protein PLL57_06420 [Flavobacteriales bacterium]|nr:hypothetical protein [Flavobacteriales bacterium]
MKWSVLHIILQLFVLSAGAQSDFVLIIDTVITPSDGFNVRPLDPESANWMTLTNDLTDRITTYHKEWNERPNVLVHIPNGVKEGGMRLDLDDDGGELTIRWTASSDLDTLRISRYEVFDRCLRDTILNEVGYYAVGDSGLQLLEVKERRTPGPKPKCRKKRSQVSLTINGVTHVVPITTMRSPESTVTVYHGYIPVECGDRSYQGSDREELCKYFHGRESWSRWCYFGEVTLK